MDSQNSQPWQYVDQVEKSSRGIITKQHRYPKIDIGNRLVTIKPKLNSLNRVGYLFSNLAIVVDDEIGQYQIQQ